MNINRHNYEEYFLLYVDNELNIAQRKAVETFVAENADLRAELIMLQQSVLPADNTVFTGKHNLLKNTTAPNPINENNCEEYFVQYADDELTNEQKDQVEQFVYRNPQHQVAFELLQQVKLMPDTSIVYPDKYALYRKEEDEKAPVIRIGWKRIAVAAAVLIFAGAMGWFVVKNNGENQTSQSGNQVAVVNGSDSGKTQQPATTIKEQTQENLASSDKTPAITLDNTTNLAATTNNDKNNNKDNKKNSQSIPQVKELVKPDTQKDLAQDREEKKNNDNQENKQRIPEVPKQETLASTLKPQQVNGVDPTNRGTINTQVKNNDLAVVTPKVDPELIKQTAVTQEIDPDEIFAANNDNNKKNRSRGFFRKVSRVFDKATNADPDHEKSSIRIASFEIALK